MPQPGGGRWEGKSQTGTFRSAPVPRGAPENGADPLTGGPSNAHDRLVSLQRGEMQPAAGALGWAEALMLGPRPEEDRGRPGAAWWRIARTAAAAARALQPGLSSAQGSHGPLWEASSRKPGAHTGFLGFCAGRRSYVSAEHGGEGRTTGLWGNGEVGG